MIDDHTPNMLNEIFAFRELGKAAPFLYKDSNWLQI